MRTLRLDVDRPAMLVVIHHRDLELTQANAHLAVQGGADGVFLIDHSGGSEALLDVADAVRARWPKLWIGVNLLGTSAPRAFGPLEGRDVDGLWSDAAGVDLDSSPLAREALAARERSGFAGQYFGGVEFKYQPSLGDVRRAAEIARAFMDVICTSGPGTGKAADISKLAQMREGALETPLAVASGVTPENAAPLVGVVDAVLVATGVSHDFHHLDGDRIAALRHVLGERWRGRRCRGRATRVNDGAPWQMGARLLSFGAGRTDRRCGLSRASRGREPRQALAARSVQSSGPEAAAATSLRRERTTAMPSTVRMTRSEWRVERG